MAGSRGARRRWNRTTELLDSYRFEVCTPHQWSSSTHTNYPRRDSNPQSSASETDALSIRPRGRSSRYYCLIAHTRSDRPFAVHSFSSSLSQGLDTVAHECLHAQKTYYKHAPREIDLIQENNIGLIAQIGRARVCSRWLRSTFQNWPTFNWQRWCSRAVFQNISV